MAILVPVNRGILTSLIIKSPSGVRDVVLGLFTTANQRFSRLVYNANMSRRDK
jgi:hypothetical protein